MNEQKNVFSLLYKFITKDIAAENESKRCMVIIRFQYLFLFAYCLITMILAGSSFLKGSMLFCIAFAIIFVGVFFITYHSKTRTSLWVFIFFMLLWMTSFLYFFGWGIGIQNFLCLLLLVYFLATYKKTFFKGLFTIGITLIALLYYIVFKNRIPVCVFSISKEYTLGIINILFFFMSVSFAVYEMSNNVGELEGKLVKYNDTLKQQANTDQLTGLYNRRRALDFLNELVSDFQGNTFSLCIGDIDHFKRVNDEYGHDAGDEVLKAVSKTMMDSLRKDSFLARWGGEEFLLVFPDSNGDEAFSALERLRSKIQNMKVHVNDVDISVTMTFGLTEFDFDAGIDSSIKEADEKLYHGKENGRNQIVY